MEMVGESGDFETTIGCAKSVCEARAANRASKGGSGGADVVARQTGGYNFYYHSSTPRHRSEVALVTRSRGGPKKPLRPGT